MRQRRIQVLQRRQGAARTDQRWGRQTCCPRAYESGSASGDRLHKRKKARLAGRNAATATTRRRDCAKVRAAARPAKCRASGLLRASKRLCSTLGRKRSSSAASSLLHTQRKRLRTARAEACNRCGAETRPASLADRVGASAVKMHAVCQHLRLLKICREA